MSTETDHAPGRGALITIHVVNDVQWSNLNRDDTGTPKRTILGDVPRGMLSPQSLKRAARKDYESRIMETYPDASYRSRRLDAFVIDRARQIAAQHEVELDEKEAAKRAKTVIKYLTSDPKKKAGAAKSTSKSAEDSSADEKSAAKETGAEDTTTWLSVEEMETLASALVDAFSVSAPTSSGSEASVTEKADVPANYTGYLQDRGITGSLAIAAFGRMFANQPGKQTEAAVSVSPAVSTHRSAIETDYFTAVDDYPDLDAHGMGADHVNTAMYTSGIFYRTVTIDPAQLWANWSGHGSQHAQEQLEQLVTSLVRALPSGKKTSTAPYTIPPLVVAETQSYRVAYSVSRAVKPSQTGFLDGTIVELRRQFDLARKIDAENFGPYVVSGLEGAQFDSEAGSLGDLVRWVVDRIASAAPQD